MMETEIDKEILDTRFKLKQLSQLKKQYKKLSKVRLIGYKPPVYFVFNDVVNSCLNTFERLVKR